MANESMALPSITGKEVIKAVVNGFETDCGPDFKVSGIFSSHMVLQRDRPIHIFGFSNRPGTVVTGEFGGERATAAVGEDRKWTLTFKPRPYSRIPASVRISDGAGRIVVFEDVLIGDVWLIGGQSNAEHHLESCVPVTPGLTFDENDSFRLFAQSRRYVFDHSETINAPQRDIANPEWQWKRPGEAASLEFSAMGWFFAKELIKNVFVPQGLIMCGAGGACLRELIPEELARAIGYTSGANVPLAGYYNSLIHPLIGIGFKGQLFFQGESEGCVRSTAETYARDLALAVYDERLRFGFNFPFYNVQLSDYPRDGIGFFPYTDIVRVEQFKALSRIPNSALTVDMDLGSHEDTPDWAHSPYKAELGRRLAALVLAREYGIGAEAEASSPTPESARFSPDGNKVFVRFIGTNGALKTAQGTPEVRGFSFGDRDNRVPATAEIISNDEVCVTVPNCADVSVIGYAFSVTVNETAANLRGGTSLPVPAFLIPVEKEPHI